MLQIQGRSDRKSFQLSAKEYVILCLVRYPTVAPTSSTSWGTRSDKKGNKSIDSLEHLTIEAANNWIASSCYFFLLSEHMNQYFPNEKFGEIGLEPAGVREPDIDEYFIRIAIDLWMDTAPVVRVNHGNIVPQRPQRTRGQSYISKSGPTLTDVFQ